jgi:hypothetical protein
VWKESTEKMKWTKGDQKTIMELVLWKQIYIVTNTPFIVKVTQQPRL